MFEEASLLLETLKKVVTVQTLSDSPCRNQLTAFIWCCILPTALIVSLNTDCNTFIYRNETGFLENSYTHAL